MFKKITQTMKNKLTFNGSKQRKTMTLSCSKKYQHY